MCWSWIWNYGELATREENSELLQAKKFVLARVWSCILERDEREQALAGEMASCLSLQEKEEVLLALVILVYRAGPT